MKRFVHTIGLLSLWLLLPPLTAHAQWQKGLALYGEPDVPDSKPGTVVSLNPTTFSITSDSRTSPSVVDTHGRASCEVYQTYVWAGAGDPDIGVSWDFVFEVNGNASSALYTGGRAGSSVRDLDNASLVATGSTSTSGGVSSPSTYTHRLPGTQGIFPQPGQRTVLATAILSVSTEARRAEGVSGTSSGTAYTDASFSAPK